jgi:hypothetical protein
MNAPAPRTANIKRRMPLPRRRLAMCSAIALAVGLAALAAMQARFVTVGAQAYLYGYPLVIMDVTRQHSLRTAGAENELRRVRQFPDARFKAVVRPNVDTLYTTAFIDMSQGPWVFEMAPNAQRYEVMPFLDAWTHVIATLGTRTSGTAGGKYLLVGPGWKGAVPADMKLLRSPTRLVWLIGRTQTNGVADYPLVHHLQDGLALRQFGAEGVAPLTPPVHSTPTSATRVAPALPPQQKLQQMNTDEFFNRLAHLMVDNPPALADAPMLLALAGIGIQPGQPFQSGALDRASLRLGRWLADYRLNRELKQARHLVRGWATPSAKLGQYGTDYNLRAAVAMVGLGANLPADAMYPHARLDAKGEPLHGGYRYRLHFNAGELPPTRAFWSVTAYGLDDFLIDNPLGRYALGDRDPLVFNPDGSLDLWIQSTEPAPDKRANWLPVAAGQPFVLNARLYWPQETALSGTWSMPAVERVQ